MARLFSNTYPNTLDTTIQSTACLAITDNCNPLSYIITGDINAMWIRDSTNQLLPYIDLIKQDGNLKRLFLGAIYLQAQFLTIDPYANAFKEPMAIEKLAQEIRTSPASTLRKREVFLQDGGTFEFSTFTMIGH